MIKDILTVERIKYDYKKQLLNSMKTLLIMPIIVTLLLALIIYLFSRLDRLFLVLEILLVTPLLLVIYIYFCVLIESYRDYSIIKKESFKIVTDKLISSQEKATYVGSSFTASFNSPYTLNFSSYGQYYIVNGENYSSSTLYSMSDKGVFNYSSIGDTFYLVIDKKERILLAYNTKLFDFQY